jgi:trehalose/maltose hydrolase-like predicted phosphorylase
MGETNNQQKSLYPHNNWQIIEEAFDVEMNNQNETIFALGNGYIGMRGNFEEGYNGPKNTSLLGTYLNGFYESEPISYGEAAYGFAKNNQTMLNVTDSKCIKLYLDEEVFDLFAGKILQYRRVLDMKTGILTRDIGWESPAGKQVEISIQRVVSLTNKHLAAIRYTVKPINFSGKVSLLSALDGKVTNQECEDDPRVGSALQGQVLQTIDKRQQSDFSALMQKTSNTAFALVCAMSNKMAADAAVSVSKEPLEEQVRDVFCVDAKEGERVCLTKFITYYSSRDYPENELMTLAHQTLKRATKAGFDKIVEDQRQYLDDFWQHGDIEIDGDPAMQQGLRFNQFQLLQSVGRDGKTNIASKGVTGEGYEGHYFWDTEVFVLPFFLYTKPEISRQLLHYRYSTLDKARERAREMSHPKGALYPWRTINGEECSAYFPAGTAQYHINADIIHALKLYMEATNDIDFMLKYGAEMLFETARFWASLGSHVKTKDNQFCINCVTGPDEYTAIVNNNFYTNIMAQMNLQYADDIAQLLKESHASIFNELCERINLDPAEILAWKKAAELMYLPYDETLKLHPQDDTFLAKAPWDFEHTPAENYPLLLHYHPLVIYRYQVCKQADVVLADLWFGDKMSLADKKRDYDFYEPLTTHDSSLSPCVFSILASEVGYHEKAYDYFTKTARLDLDNLQGNTRDGIHSANMAGAWMCMAFGFAGMRTYQGKLSFNPYLPGEWQAYRLRVNFQDRLISVAVNAHEVTYTLLAGEPLAITHAEQSMTLQKENPSVFKLA